jgi:DNA polymerase-3 subunit epsilon
MQRTFEDLGVPLSEVTFCVLDLETTGGSPADDGITEIGALKVLRGETLGTFHTLVDPGRPVPAFIRMLTGINDAMLIEAPAIESVLPSLLEFLRGTVLVAHNARFDVGFLNASLQRAGYDKLDNTVMDTARLARKILQGEVPNHRLETLSRHLRCSHQPCHRAFADVLATTDVLHHLIERVSGYGVTTLQDLVSVSRVRLDGTFQKIRLTDDLPHTRGVYRFLGAAGNTLYIGKASDIRSRVRSYFYGDTRGRIRDLLRETDRIAATEYTSLLEAEVVEARAIAREQPPYNRAGKGTGTWYLKFSLKGRAHKVRPARVVKEGDGNLYIGPFRSRRIVQGLVDGLQDCAPIHRCAEPARCRGCAFGEMNGCAGTDLVEHNRWINQVAAAVRSDHSLILTPLKRKMLGLARQERFEEAAEIRERGAGLARAVFSFAQIDSLRRAGEVVVRDERRALLFREGVLVAAVDIEDENSVVAGLLDRARRDERGDAAREGRILLSYLRRAEVELLHCSGEWALEIGCRPVAPWFSVH